MDLSVVVPVRWGSTRFPGKALATWKGKPILAHLLGVISQISGVSEIVVVTDHEGIAKVAKQDSDVRVVMSRTVCHSGSERALALVTEEAWRGDRHLLHVQADELFVLPEHLERLVAEHKRHTPEFSTLAAPLLDATAGGSEHLVKVVFDNDQRALYFSRSLVPWAAEGTETPLVRYHHMGVYLYSVATLKQYQALPATHLESMERLEQLRWLSYGASVRVTLLDRPIPKGIDVPDDLRLAM